MTRCWGVVVLAALLAGCGAGTSSAGTPPTSTAPSEGTSSSEGTPASEGALPTAPSEIIDPALACSGPGDCTGSYLGTVPQTEADCACRTCAVHIVGLAGLEQRSEADQRVCGAWHRTHDCPPVTCAERSDRALCVRGMCVAAPVVDADEPSPCRSPADCPRGAACVTGALGGEIGCTNETCCGTAECHNGCSSDADCPACRSSCVSGSCRNPNGPM